MLETGEEVVSEQVEKAGDAAVGETPAPEEAQQDEVVVSIGDEPAADVAEVEQAPAWVKKVRQRNRELERELKEARRKLQETGATKEPEVGEKPTLLACDYDTEKYEQALTSWHDRKRKADERAAAARSEEERASKEWQGKLATYQQAKTAFKAPDFDEAEAVVLDMLDQTQQGIIVHGAADAALVVYALGKNEEKAKEIAAIKDPVRFAFAVAKLEGQLKVTTRKPTIQPEGRIVGSGSSRLTGTADSTLNRLREEAAKTGDYTKVTAYKRTKRE